MRARTWPRSRAAQVICVDWWENGMFYLTQSLGQVDSLATRIAELLRGA